MGVDRRVARGPGQILVLAVQDVIPGSRVAELFGQPEIDEEQLGKREKKGAFYF